MENKKILDIEVSFYLEPNQILDSYIKQTYKVKEYEILKKSIDSRKQLRYFYRVKVSVDSQFANKLIRQKRATVYTPKKGVEIIKKRRDKSFIIVGTGPSGLISGLILTEAGYRVTFIEQGNDVEKRTEDVANFFNNRDLNEYSNIQFGEGGAGTFSDGKIVSRVKNPIKGWIYKKLVEFGAPKEIEYLSHPHIGTDKLKLIIKKIREYLENSGAKFNFNTKVIDIIIENRECKKLVIKNVVNQEIREVLADEYVFGVGNSARDLFLLFEKRGFKMELKPTAIGYRIVHKQEIIDNNQYGKNYKKFNLPPSEYFLTNREKNQNVYSFCMCPGGYVVNGASRLNSVVTNGMSNYNRDSQFANSAILSSFDLPNIFDNVKTCLEYFNKIEERGFKLGNSDYLLPAMSVNSYLNRRKRGIETEFEKAVLPGIYETDIKTIFNEFPEIDKSISNSLIKWEKRVKGFISSGAMLVAPETRSSSPVRILRDENMRADTFNNIYVVGEGAGYAGGITSSMIDGAKMALLFV